MEKANVSRQNVAKTSKRAVLSPEHRRRKPRSWRWPGRTRVKPPSSGVTAPARPRRWRPAAPGWGSSGGRACLGPRSVPPPSPSPAAHRTGAVGDSATFSGCLNGKRQCFPENVAESSKCIVLTPEAADRSRRWRPRRPTLVKRGSGRAPAAARGRRSAPACKRTCLQNPPPVNPYRRCSHVARPLIRPTR